MPAIMNSSKIAVPCFGFYGECPECMSICPKMVASQCRSTLMTHGFTIVTACVKQDLTGLLDIEGETILRDVVSEADLAKVLQDPYGYRLSKEEQDLLAQIAAQTVSLTDLGLDSI